MKAHKISFFYIMLLAATSFTAHAAQLASAKVVEVGGTVTKYTADGQQSPLQVGEIVKEGDSISVTALSFATLIFSNGSELTIEENTSVEISKLQQDSFTGGKSYEQLQADPSKSQTILSLNYGELTGHVKKLRADSRFDIETPLGTAAIRGTIWSVILIYNAERAEFLLIAKNFDGAMDIISRYIGEFQYGEGNIGDKGYDSSISEAATEAIPMDHTIVIRLRASDPLYDDLINIIDNNDPTGPSPVYTPGDLFGNNLEENDLGVIVPQTERSRRRIRLGRLILAGWIIRQIIIVSPEGQGPSS